MYRVWACLTQQHDIALICGAVLICAVSCLAALILLERAAMRSGALRRVWVGLAVCAFGSGTWATHFIAMLAFDPGLPLSFDIATTGVSGVVAILGAAAAFAPLAAGRGRAWLLGGVLGGGVAIMHYIGMASLRLSGVVVFDPSLVLASVLVAVACGGCALAAARALHGRQRLLLGTLLLAATVASLHFTGMGAVAVVPDGNVVVSPLAVSRGVLAAVIGLAASVLLLGTAGAVAVDISVAASEARRMTSIADAAFEGIALCHGTRITQVNAALAAMAGLRREALVGAALGQIIPTSTEADLHRLLQAAGEAPVTTSLSAAEGAMPVEIRVRRVGPAEGNATVLVVRDLRERSAAEARIRHLAHHDSLTGLANRAMLREQLEQALALGRRHGQQVAVLCLDLDRFKAVNDGYGHAAGDRLLLEIGRRLLACARDSDVVARLGGDEFVVLLTQVNGAEGAQALAQRIIDDLAQPVDLGELRQASVGCSMGIAVFPDDGDSVDGLLVNADLALYRVKDAGGNGFAFFKAEMDAEARARRALDHDLRLAMQRHELRLAYQPQADAGSGRVCGFEALLRWNHPLRGAVPPDVFIPVAEANGTIGQIGAWVLQEACAEAMRWAEPLRLAINVSPAQFEQGDFAALVEQVLDQTGLPAARLELEITEGVLIRNTERTLGLLTRIQALGVGIAMDDFGTGYSSLSTLRSFPFDRIKIDRSFVRDLTTNPGSAAIVQAVLGLARGLNLPVVAEGVEDDAQLAALRLAGCAEVQGYLIGRPLPIEAFRHLTHPGKGLAGVAPRLAHAG